MVLPFGFLSLGLRIAVRQQRLIISTGWRVRVLTLGLALRQVEIDPERRTIVVESRHGWLFTSRREIRFDEVKAVTYGYGDESTDQYFSFAHDTFDVYRIGLRLKVNAEEIHLFRYVGEGTWVNSSDWPLWMHDVTAYLDFSGTQDRDSLALVEAICGMLGVRVRPPS